MDNQEAVLHLKYLKDSHGLWLSKGTDTALDIAIEALSYDEIREVRFEEVITFCKKHDLALVSADIFERLTGERANVDGNKGN
jgi:hypothetical protein